MSITGKRGWDPVVAQWWVETVVKIKLDVSWDIEEEAIQSVN